VDYGIDDLEVGGKRGKEESGEENSSFVGGSELNVGDKAGRGAI